MDALSRKQALKSSVLLAFKLCVDLAIEMCRAFQAT